MTFPRYFVDRPILAIVLSLLILIAGRYALAVIDQHGGDAPGLRRPHGVRITRLHGADAEHLHLQALGLRFGDAHLHRGERPAREGEHGEAGGENDARHNGEQA